MLSVTAVGFSQTTTFPAPVDFPYANDFKVKVNDKESFVYDNRVAAYTIFEIVVKQLWKCNSLVKYMMWISARKA